MKKFLKILGVVLLLLVILIATAPYLFKDQIRDLLTTKLNESLTAEVTLADLNLSLFSNFPHAAVTADGLLVQNTRAPFAGDTLVYADRLKLDLPLSTLWQDSSKPLAINQFILDKATINILVDSTGTANYDIAKQDSTTTTSSTEEGSSGFQLDLKHYEINDSKLLYHDQSSANYLLMTDLNHDGTGDFSQGKTTLETHTDAAITYRYGKTEYVSSQPVRLDAELFLDLEERRYEFRENEAMVNDLPLTFDGYVQMFDNYTDMDLHFTTPDSEFMNFLRLVPDEYRKNLEGVTTTGNFKLDGKIDGKASDERIPNINIQMQASNASVQYPDLPQKLTRIDMDARLLNDTGDADDTYLEISQIGFNVGTDRLNGSAMISNLTGNIASAINLAGRMNLANLASALPLENDTELAGTLDTDVTATFDMESLEKERYQNIKSSGKLLLTDFIYSTADMEKPVQLKVADLKFNPGRVALNRLEAQLGRTDLQAAGTIDNLLAYLFSDASLRGNFQALSNQFYVADFMSEDEPVQDSEGSSTPSSSANGERFKIPEALDIEAGLTANTVFYDDIQLRNVKAQAIVRDQAITLNDVQSDVFGGRIGMNGTIFTKNAPRFDMNLDMSQLNLAQSFQGLDMLQRYAPILEVVQGTLNTQLKLSGDLNSDLTPALSTLAGNAFANVMTRDIEPSQTPLLSRLDQELNFIDLNDIDISDLTANLTFNDGKVQVKPFNFTLGGMTATLGGTHGLENEMDYTLALNVPGSYLGSDVSSLLSQLSAQEQKNMTIDLPIQFTGSMTQPNIKLNLEQAVTDLTTRIVEQQRDELKDKGKDALKDVVDDVLSGKDPQDAVNDILKGRKGENNTQEDSTGKKPKDKKDKLKEAAGGLLRGVLGKKKDTTR